jgi:parallel beta-helix repeat protein
MKIKLLIPLLALSFASFSQTIVPAGTVSGTWTATGSPYLVQGSIMIPNDSSLIIQPGVTVNFQGHYKLLVMGRLLATGTVSDSIHFTAANTSTGWYGIRFDNTSSTNDSSKISYCSIRWGNANGSGYDANGGGVMLNNFSKVVISNCLIRNNASYSPYGGGIYCSNSNAMITSNTISYCNGGIYVANNGNPQILNNVISYNLIQGINVDGGNSTLNIKNNIITYNATDGITCTGSSTGGSTCSISGNTIMFNNTLDNSGFNGGITCTAASPLISNNIISNNNGSGISCQSSAPVISGNVITNNSAHFSFEGGGIFITYSMSTSPLLINNTIANNVSVNGGGMFCFNSNPVVINCIFFGNTATSGNGPQIYLDDEPSDPTFHHCDIEGGTAAFGLNGNFYTGSYSNNLNTDPLFISASAGAGTGFNGATSDWSLTAGSGCIDTGDPTGSYPSTDIAGGARISGPAIDIGAYEFQGATGIPEPVLLSVPAYPDPFVYYTFLEMKFPLTDAEVLMTDLYGRTVKRTQHISGALVKIERDELRAGIYVYRIFQNNCLISTGKLIVQD